MTLTPLTLLGLASINLFLISGLKPQPYYMVLPLLVGGVLGALIQYIIRQRNAVHALNTALAEVNRVLSLQQTQTRSNLERVHAAHGTALVAIGAVHDIRNLFSPIAMGAEIAMTEGTDDDGILADMAEAAQRGVALANKILSTLDQSDFSPRRVDIAETLREILVLVQPLLVEPVWMYEEIERADLWLDTDDLFQIVHNLVLNAQNAIGARLRMQIVGAVQGDSYHINFIDNGPGMPPEILGRFKQASSPSLGRVSEGLGLAIVQHLVSRNEASLEVESGPMGTRIRLTFSLLIR